MDLTRVQIEMYVAIKYYIKKNGYSPSVRELGEIVGNSSPSSVFQKLKKLKEKGYIDYKDKRSRTIRIIKDILD